MTASLKISGTSPSTIRLAKPSAIAVLPTPASPTNKGLFLRRRHNTCTVRSISASRPISGSILPSNAWVFRLVAYLSKGLALSPISASSPWLLLLLASVLRCSSRASSSSLRKPCAT